MNNCRIVLALISLKQFRLVTSSHPFQDVPKVIQKTTDFVLLFVLSSQSYHVRELLFATHLNNLCAEIWAISGARIEKNIKVQNSNNFSNLYMDSKY